MQTNFYHLIHMTPCEVLEEEVKGGPAHKTSLSFPSCSYWADFFLSNISELLLLHLRTLLFLHFFIKMRDPRGFTGGCHVGLHSVLLGTWVWTFLPHHSETSKPLKRVLALQHRNYTSRVLKEKEIHSKFCLRRLYWWNYLYCET